jgi:hypothetical protein
MTHSEKKKEAKFKEAYQRGVTAHKSGMADTNQYSKADLMEYCSFSGGYFDSKRGLA